MLLILHALFYKGLAVLLHNVTFAIAVTFLT